MHDKRLVILIPTVHGASEFIRHKATSERSYVLQYGHPRFNYCRSAVETELPEEMLNLLEKYLKLIPAMLPPPTPDDIDAATLWHPDLHANNLFVDPETFQITSIIDWQSTIAAPLFFQSTVPQIVRHRAPVSLDLSSLPKLCDNYNDLSQDEKEYAENMHKSEHLHQYYLRSTRDDNPRHWTAMQPPNEFRVHPVKIVQQVWVSNTVYYLRRALVQIAAEWEKLCPGAGPCPVSFGEVDLSLLDLEQENRETVSGILKLIRDCYGLHPDGTISPEKYDTMQSELKRLKESALAAAESELERLCIDKTWPYEDTLDRQY